MKYHILNGDALLEQVRKIPIKGEFIIIREALVEGRIKADSLDNFWEERADFLTQAYGISQEDYFSNSIAEFNKIQDIPENSSVYLWFERDLFCQVNLWFTIHYLKSILTQKNLYPYLILPNHQEWTGFRGMSPDQLMSTYGHRIQLKKKQLQFFADLWDAYQQNDLSTLTQLSLLLRKPFPYLEEVVEAHKARFTNNGLPGRPHETIRKIIAELQTADFENVFKEFSKREGIYGFGDLQVKRIYEQILNDNL